MNLRQLLKFLFRRDTTFRGEFSAIGAALPADAAKYVVDVGANDGFYGSNSYPFIARGWEALMIEPDPRPFAALSKRFAGNPRVQCLNLACADKPGELPLRLGQDASHSSLVDEFNPALHGASTGESVTVQVERLADVLARHRFPSRFGVLSIDTEGMDLEVLRGLDLGQWRPQVIFTEDFAPKDAEKAALLQSHGYRLIGPVDSNTLWKADRG
jgi:FkbM family methyltransferase